MPIRNPILLAGLLLGLGCLLLPGCSNDTPAPDATPASTQNAQSAPEPAAKKPAETAIEEQTPPGPPLFEDFQGEPQISLFPRAGDFRPEDQATERLPFWRTFIDHLRRVSGVIQSQEDGNRAWGFRSIDTIDSIAWFAPLAVEPATGYKVSCRIRTDLPENASAGLGVLEFDNFRWLGEQYPESLFRESHRKTHDGIRLSGKNAWKAAEFRFTTGPDTRMIHLVLFREGAHDRNPVLFDDIRIERTP